MANPVIGHITCPHCGNSGATVHRESRGKKAMYYRCYDGDKGECGTVQVRGNAGQAFILKNMRPLNTEETEQQAAEVTEEVKETVKQESVKVEKKKKSLLDALWSED